ncbi:putative ribonuclease H-like domain-containing protein [Tanacetum coccineum]|uniref:Ribonuclease H-like domain-containing protein n=1 Tax=Tanacetum coccineum TaxID=301880 RepID=A0ABQ5HTF9_9ASTR
MMLKNRMKMVLTNENTEQKGFQMISSSKDVNAVGTTSYRPVWILILVYSTTEGKLAYFISRDKFIAENFEEITTTLLVKSASTPVDLEKKLVKVGKNAVDVSREYAGATLDRKYTTGGMLQFLGNRQVIIIFGSTNKELCTGFEKLMKDKFQMSSMGELTFFLGLQVQQKEDGIFISQDKYVAEILKKFNYSDVKSASTPVDLEKPLVKDGDADDVDVHLYRSMIGSLMYLTASRPDIMFAVCACARFQVTPKTSHLLAVKRIFRYLKGKPTLGLWYSRDSPFELVAYTDSDYAGATLDRKSTTGGCQFLGNRLISWQCKKQTVVATSTTEAEYVAAASCCGQVLWIQNQLLDYGYNFMNTVINIDNNSTICIIENPVQHSKTKHIEIRHHFIRDCNTKKLIQVVKIHTDLNVADLLTKGFDAGRFQYLVSINYYCQTNVNAVKRTWAPKLQLFSDSYQLRHCLRGEVGTPRYLSLVVPLTKVGDEAVHKELGDRMERAATTASSLEAEQDSGAKIHIGWDVHASQTRFETTSKQFIDPPLSRGYTLRSGEDSMKLIEIDEIFSKFAETHNVVAFLEKPEESDGFAEIIDFLKASSVSYALTVNPVIYTSYIEQFWAIAKVQTVNGVWQIQALVDKKRVVVTESSIRRDLHLDDAEGTDCLPTASNLKILARDGITPLFDTMMVQPVEEIGEDSDNPTDSTPIPIIDQPSSSSQPKKDKPSKKVQRQEAEVPQDEAEHEESVPTPSNDPQASGEDSMKLTDLMVLCTKLQTQVLDLQKAKDAQAKEIAALKKRIQRLERRKISRPTGLKRLRKVGMSQRIESSEDQESLGVPEDASKQGRSIEDIDADVDVSLVDETQERQDDDLIFDTGVLDDVEMPVEAKVDGKDEQSTKKLDDSTAGEAVTTAGDDSVVPTTNEEITLAQTLIQIKAAKPKVVTTAATTTTTTRPKDKGVVVQEPSEFRVPQEIKPSSSKDKGKGIMIEPEVPLKRKDQIALDEQIARDIQAKLDAELLEEQKLARKQEEEANIALIESWENTQAMMEADRLLAERLQSKEREELTDEEKAKLFMELMEKRRKHFAALRAQEKRNRPPTKAQKRTQMSTYLKHMGGYTYKQLKGKSFDEIQKLFDKEMKRVNTFVAMGSEVQER